jgi:hypothetical protein
VTEPLRAEPDRAKRLQVFFERWIDWLDQSGLPGGCRSSPPRSSSTTCRAGA